MAIPQLNELFDWLKSNGNNRFEIYDYERKNTIEKCAGYEDLTSGGKSLEDYFIALADKGVKTVQIVQKKKNGSTYIRESCGLNYSLSTGANNNVAASGSPVYPGATPQQPQYPTGLGSPSSGFGLGFPEIMSMRSNADRYEEAKNENRELKAKVERLEAENRKLETECLTHKLGAESKPSAVDKLVEGLASNPAALATLIQSFKGSPSANPGLNAPQDSNLSDTKKLVIETIKNHTDENVTAAYYILAMAEQNNREFLQKYHNLLTEFNIIQDGSDSESDRV